MERVRLRKIVNIAGVGIGAVLLCFLLIVLSYKLPFEPIKENVRESLSLLNEEGVYPQFFEGGGNSQLDNYTDALILSEAMCVGEGTIKDAMLGCAYRGDNDTILSLNMYFEEGNHHTVNVTHYWHGNLTVIRPLLMLFNYSQIRVINLVGLSIMLCSILYLMYSKKIDTKYIVAFVLSLLFINGWIFPFSIQFSCMFYITFAEIILVLKYNDYFKVNNRYYVFFMLSGLFTSYFDYLTVPVVSLGMPLIFLSLINEDDIDQKFAVKAFIYCLLWAMGYFGMWLAKWVIATVVLGDNYVLKGMSSFLSRAASETHLGEATPWSAVKRNLDRPSGIAYRVFFVVSVGLFLWGLWKVYKKEKKSLINKSLLFYVPVIFMPMVWYIFLKNHSYIHAFFTYRGLIISVFGILVLLLRVISEPLNSEFD